MGVRPRAAFSLLSLLLLALVACSERPVQDVEVETSTPPESPAEESPLSPPPTPTPVPPQHTSPLLEPESSPVEGESGLPAQVASVAKKYLAQEVGVASEDVEIISSQSVEWSDASLGCPKPGQAYAQVITPGYRIELQVDGEKYEIHTDRSGNAMVLCGQKQEKEASVAVRYLVNELGISADEIEVLSVDRQEWPDTSLGCPEPGKSYAQVITPGYRVLLSARGEEYEVHTNETGTIVVLCEGEG